MTDKVTFLQPKTASLSLSTALKANSHAYLLTGLQGIGKTDIAMQLAGHWLGVKTSEVGENSSVLVFGKNGESMGIDEIRSLQQFLLLKTIGNRRIRRVVIILDAQNMSIEAQNAMLKTLEEPPEDTQLILTTSDMRALRPTILSRVQAIRLHPISKELARKHFSKLGHNETDVDEAYNISQGAVSLMAGLLNEADEHPQTLSLKKAKEVLTQTAYQRLLIVDELSKQKDQISLIVESCKLIAQSGLRQAVQKGESYARWENMLRILTKAQDSLSKNANAKLLLTDLFVRL